MKQQLLENIENLLKKFNDPAFPDDLEQIKSWRSEVKRAIITDNLREHEGIKMIIEKFNSDIEEINAVLINANSEKLPDRNRDRLLEYKKMIEGFLELFPTEKNLEVINKAVKENL